MNKVVLLGRLTKDVELRYSANGETAIARFTVAVSRRGKKDEADFIQCKAFGKTAELIEKYFRKGSQICIVGRIETGSYDDKDGKKVYTTDVICEDFDFIGKKDEQKQEAPKQTEQTADPWDDLPF